MTIADDIFAAQAEYVLSGYRAEAAIMQAFGFEYEQPGSWPHDRIRYDRQERSWTLTEVRGGWAPTQSQIDAATRALGFQCGWIWYEGNPVATCCEPTEG